MDAAGDAAGRPRQHPAGGEPPGLGDRRDPAMRLDDQGGPAIPGFAQPRLQPRQIARQHRPDIGVDDGGRDPLELLDLRQHVGRQRDIGVGQRAGERLAGQALMARVAPGVEIAHGDRLDPRVAQNIDSCCERRHVERRLDAAVGAHALAHPEAQMPRRQLLGRRQAKVVAVVLQPLAHLDDVAVALGGQQAEPRALVLQQRVGRHRGAVDDALGLGEQRGAAVPEPGGERGQPVEHADRRVVRGRRHLGQRRPAGRVDRDEIGKRAADIDADAIQASVLVRSASRRRTRSRCRGRGRRRCARRVGPSRRRRRIRRTSTSPGRMTMPISLVRIARALTPLGIAAYSDAARRPRRRGCRTRRARTPSPAVLPSAGSVGLDHHLDDPAGAAAILPVAAGIGAELVAPEEQRKAHLGDFEAAELDAARRLPLAGARPAVADRRARRRPAAPGRDAR